MVNFEIWITLALLGTAILFFVTEWLSVDLVALGLMIALMVTGILSPQEALAGFSSPIVITVATLFIVGGSDGNWPGRQCLRKDHPICRRE